MNKFKQGWCYIGTGKIEYGVWLGDKRLDKGLKTEAEMRKFAEDHCIPNDAFWSDYKATQVEFSEGRFGWNKWLMELQPVIITEPGLYFTGDMRRIAITEPAKEPNQFWGTWRATSGQKKTSLFNRVGRCIGEAIQIKERVAQ